VTRGADKPGTARTVSPEVERIFGRHYRGPRPWVIGAAIVVLLVVLSYIAYTKQLPFSGPGYELHATFENAATLRADSPVRIAGVNVGKVQSVEGVGDAAEVTFTVSDEGRPVHEDATIQIRPRLFLEGNFFLDVQPGSPSSPELDDGADIPITQTSTAVQLDEVLTALQSDTRRNLQVFLNGYGTALTHEPTSAEDADQDADAQGESAAQALNDAFHYSATGNRDIAIANEALLGTEPHDLSRMIAANARVFGVLLTREDDLQNLITNFNTTMGALASESTNVSESVRQLAPVLEAGQPALRHLSEALPPLRAFARELTPGVEELPATIRAGEPWLHQARKLLRPGELGGLARLLKRGAPSLARTTDATAKLFPQITRLSRCATDVLDPAGDVVIDDAGGAYPFSTGQSNFNEFLYGLVNLAGESQTFDGNGAYVRFQSGGGPVTVKSPNPVSANPQDAINVGNTISAPIATRPTFHTGDYPPLNFDKPCYQNDVPDINGAPEGQIGPASPVVAP
jgi:phospholipid/cholesterol/gamma-HCH transport system substrate-binding protein